MSNKSYSNLICPICENKGDYVREEEEIYCIHCGLVIETPYHYTAGIRFKTLVEILDDERDKKYLKCRRRKEHDRIKKFQKV